MAEYNASDRKLIRKAEKDAKLAELQRREVISGIMSVGPGRSWMLGRLESAHVFATSYNENALAMAFAEGERNQGLQLLSDIMWACPQQYIQMMVERNERDSASRVSRGNHEDSDGGDSTDSGSDDPNRGDSEPGENR